MKVWFIKLGSQAKILVIFSYESRLDTIIVFMLESVKKKLEEIYPNNLEFKFVSDIGDLKYNAIDLLRDVICVI